MKRELQEKLYKKLSPTSSDDYFKKLIKFSEQSPLLKKLKNKNNKFVCN
jgi:hypothetical protein